MASGRRASADQRGAHEIDPDDAAPVGHGRGDAGGVGDGAERPGGRDPVGEATEPVLVGDVEREGLDLRGPGSGELLRRGAHGRLVEIDEDEVVDHRRQPLRTGVAHAPAGAGCDSDGGHLVDLFPGSLATRGVRVRRSSAPDGAIVCRPLRPFPTVEGTRCRADCKR